MDVSYQGYHAECLFTLPPLQTVQFEMLLILIFTCLILPSFGQTFTNKLQAQKKSGDDVMIFNIKVNGVNYFQTDQVVTSYESLEEFPFQMNLSDTIEVIFSQCSQFPGYYQKAARF